MAAQHGGITAQYYWNTQFAANTKKPSLSSLEKMRFKQTKNTEILINSAPNRLRNIRDYLKFNIDNFLYKSGVSPSLRSSLEAAREFIISSINARVPDTRNLSAEPRQGLQLSVIRKLIKIINPESEQNPWESNHCRVRNQLIIFWLLKLGLRRGELLKIRVRDINFRASEVRVLRQHDDPDEPRKNEPRHKTRERELSLNQSLLLKTHAYILKYRSGVKGANKHDYLFVSDVKGAPLSISSLNKIFVVLQGNLSYEGVNLFPHALRHTWND